MSTIRTLSLLYRTQRAERREALAAQAVAAQQKLFEAMLKSGKIKLPAMVERTGRMVLPRERLVQLTRAKWARDTGFAVDTMLGATALRAYGHRSGYGKQYEVVTIPRKPSRNKYQPPRNKTWEPLDAAA